MKDSEIMSILLFRSDAAASADVEEEWTLTYDSESLRLRVLHRRTQPGDQNRMRFEMVRDLDPETFLAEDCEHPAAIRLISLFRSLFER